MSVGSECAHPDALAMWPVVDNSLQSYNFIAADGLPKTSGRDRGSWSVTGTGQGEWETSDGEERDGWWPH